MRVLIALCALSASACTTPNQAVAVTASGTAVWGIAGSGGTATVHVIDTGTVCLYALVGGYKAGLTAIPKTAIGQCVSNER